MDDHETRSIRLQMVAEPHLFHKWSLRKHLCISQILQLTLLFSEIANFFIIAAISVSERRNLSA